MSAFEKLPREVRDMVYGYCLIYDGEIIPYPTEDEREEIEDSGQKPAKRCTGRKDIKCNWNRVLQSCGGITYATDWPSIALLGVSKSTQQEAANVLFGMNVWRLSYVDYWVHGENKDLWCTYQSCFRHITTHMSMKDAGNILELTKKVRAIGKERCWTVNDVKQQIHRAGLAWLNESFEWKHELLAQMDLKSLVFNVANLFCPHGCCRRRVLYSFCQEMGQDGPWYRLEVNKEAGRSWDATILPVRLDIEAKRKIDVKVLGLENDSEKGVFMKCWGLEVE